MVYGDPATLPADHPCRQLLPGSELVVRGGRPCLVLGASSLPVYASERVARLTSETRRNDISEIAKLDAYLVEREAISAQEGDEAVEAYRANRAAVEADPRIVDMRRTVQLGD
jgi:hypothetical protein